MKNLKKFFLSFCLIISMMAVPVFASDASDMEDYYSSLMSQMSIEDQLLASGKQWFLQYFAEADETTAEYYKENSIGVMQEAMTLYGDYLANDTLGEFDKVVDTKLKEMEDGYGVIVKGKYEKMYLIMTMECKNVGGQVTPTDISFSLEEIAPKTFGEKMGTAALNTVIGLVTVFVVLALIAYIISLFKYIPALEAKFAKKKEVAMPETSNVGIVDTPESETEELVDDTELVAVITAAICASQNMSADGFVVRSIRKSKRKFD